MKKDVRILLLGEGNTKNIPMNKNVIHLYKVKSNELSANINIRFSSLFTKNAAHMQGLKTIETTLK